MLDVVLLDQRRHVGEAAQHVEVAGQLDGPLLDEADVLDAQPAGVAQGPGCLAGHPAGADDQGELLVEAPAAQQADQSPGQPPAGQHRQHVEHAEEDDDAAQLIAVALEKQGGHDQERQQRGALDHAHHLLAQAAQPIHLILTHQVVADRRQHGDDRDLPQAQDQVRTVLLQRHPAGPAADIISRDPRRRGQQHVGHQEKKAQDLAAAFDHLGPHPWEWTVRVSVVITLRVMISSRGA